MNASPQPLVLPSSHHRRFSPTNYTPTFLNASPVGVSNKIKAIQARKSRITLLSTDALYTDIRPLNFGYNTAGVANSRTEFSVLTAERLVDRSKDIRFDRIPSRQAHRSSTILNTSSNQQSFLWSNYQPSTVCKPTIPTTIRPPTIGSPKNKSPSIKIPDLCRRQNRPSFLDPRNTLLPGDARQKITSRIQALPNHIGKSRESPNNNITNPPTSESEAEEEVDDVENLPVDEEYERYLQKAIVKCADWLLKHVFK